MADPKPPLKSADPVGVVTSSGKTGYLPAEYAKDAAAQGARRASDAEMRTEQLKANEAATSEALRQKFEGSIGGTIEGAILPPLAGAARGLSIGTSDEALIRAARILGGEGAGEAVRGRLNDYKEYAPVASTVGELGAITAAAFMGDEAALGAAPNAIGRLGAAAERVVAGGLGESAAARGLGILARGAAEGGVFGAGSAMSEAALGDHELTAEALVGGAAQGAVGGMVVSGALGGVAKGLSGLRAPKVSAAELEGLAVKTYGEAAPGVGRELAAEMQAPGAPYRTGTAIDSVADKYIAARPGATASEQATQGEAWANRQNVFGKHAEATENATRSFSGSLDEALEAGRKADMASFGEAKVNQTARLVDRSQFNDQAAAAINWATDAHKTVTAISKDATAGMGPSALKKWNGYMDHIAKAIESGDSAQLYTALDSTKRFLGQEAAFGKGPFGLTVAQREFEGLYQGERAEGGLRSLLQSDVWGDGAAKAQREINSATHQMLSEGKLFSRKFTTEFGSDAGRPLYAADTSAISGFMNRLTSAANDLDAKGVESWINARRGYLRAITENYEFDAAATSAIKRESAALDRLETTYKTATKDVMLANQVKQALAEERDRGMGGAIGAVFDIANKPYTTLQRLAQLESQTKWILGKITGGTKAFIGDGDAAAKAVEPPKGKGFFSTLFEGMTPTASAAVSAAGSKGSRALFQQRVDEIGAMQGRPAMVADRVGKSLAPLEDAAPNTVASATTLALRGVDFLASKLPPSRLDGFSLQPQLQPRARASDAEISQFMRYAQAIDDPLSVLRDAKTGTLTRDQVEAVKAVYPKLYDSMRSDVLRTLSTSKTELPYGKRIQLGILLDIPTDQTLSPDFLRAIQATYTGAEKAGLESPTPDFAPPNVAGAAQTATQSAVERAA